MAAWASASELISTNPNPFERFVSRSTMICALCTVPNWENKASRSDWLTPYVRLPTYSFLPTIELRNDRLTTRFWLSGSSRKGASGEAQLAGKAMERGNGEDANDPHCHSCRQTDQEAS